MGPGVRREHRGSHRSAETARARFHRLVNVIGHRSDRARSLSACISIQKVREILTSRPQLRMRRRHEVRQHGDAKTRDGGVRSCAIRLALRNLAEIFGETCGR